MQSLRAGQVASPALPPSVSDGQGGTTASMLQLTITGTNDAASVTGGQLIAIGEDASDAQSAISIANPDANEANLPEFSSDARNYGFAFFAPAETGGSLTRAGATSSRPIIASRHSPRARPCSITSSSPRPTAPRSPSPS